MLDAGDWYAKKVQVWVWKGESLKHRVAKPEDFERLAEYCTKDITNVSIHYVAHLATPQEIECLRAFIQTVLRRAGNEFCIVKAYQLDEEL